MKDNSNSINNFVCSKIRRMRIEKGLRIQDIALRAGIPLGSYSCLETGRYRMSLENLFRVLSVLGADIRKVWPGTSSQGVELVDDEFVERAIRQAEAEQTPVLSLEDILDAVCETYGIQRYELQSPSRRRDLAEARTVAAKLTKETAHLSLVGLSRILDRNVSSLSHCLRRFGQRIPHDRRLAHRYRRAKHHLEERRGRRPDSRRSQA